MVAQIHEMGLRNLDDNAFSDFEISRLDSVEIDVDTVTINIENTMKTMESILVIIVYLIGLSFVSFVLYDVFG